MTAHRWRLFGAGVVLSTASLGASAAAAQGPSLEIRLDVLTLLQSGERSTLEAGLPGSLAVALYLDERVAVEPRVRMVRESDDTGSATQWTVGMFLPVHFTPSEGRRGVFVAPGLEFTRLGGAVGSDALLDFGVDLGVKLAVRERLSARLALMLRDGDSTSRSVLGGSFGVSLFWP